METWTQQRDGEVGRVLIVDDDASVRLVSTVNLEAEGLQVVEAADGRGALEQARRECSDLVLTDVTMPGLDGSQLAERSRGDERTHGLAPVIF
jgi:CheY-like chemotaxis protein